MARKRNDVLNELSKSSDINVQQPIINKYGQYVSHLPLSGGFATLLSWLPGVTFNQLVNSAIHNAFLVGELAAKMHEFVLIWLSELLEDCNDKETYSIVEIAKAMRAVLRKALEL